MSLWLDGRFWGPWIRKAFHQEIADLREALFGRILPALPNAEHAADAHAREMWDLAMAQPLDWSDDPGTWASWAMERGIEKYERLRGVEQSVLNMSTVMLWHLMEQQMLTFHMRQVVSRHEAEHARSTPAQHDRLRSLSTFKDRLAAGGIAIDQFAAWGTVDELRLVANTVKHGAGGSARDLHERRPDLFSPPGIKDGQGIFPTSPERLERPAGGSDIYVTERDLIAYFDAAASLWDDFSRSIEAR